MPYYFVSLVVPMGVATTTIPMLLSEAVTALYQWTFTFQVGHPLFCSILIYDQILNRDVPILVKDMGLIQGLNRIWD